MTAHQCVKIGTATDGGDQGDFVAGLTSAARLFFDQSAATYSLYNSSNRIVNQLSSVASTATVFNEDSQDIDLRVEGDNKASNLLVDASDDEVAIDGRFSLVALTPAQITADTNDYNPESTATNRSSFWRISSDASRAISGIANGLDGRFLVLVNVGANVIQLKNQDAGSSAANRIITGIGATVNLDADDTAELIYDSTTSRWRQIS